MASSRSDVFLRPYRGAKDDLDQFWRKFEVTATLQKWTDDTKKMENLPLFLESEAFLVWDELSDEDKKKPAEVKAALQSAFSLSPAQAYQKFVSRTLHAGESVDAYAADLKKLLKASGEKVADDGKNRVVIEQFIGGLPREYGKQLRTNGKTDCIQDCIAYVRNIRSAESSSGAYVAAPVSTVSVQPARGHKTKANVLCYACHNVGHFARDCPSKSHASGGSKSGSFVCHFCDEAGHIKRDCPEYAKWSKERKRGTAAAVPVVETPEKCLCLPSAGHGELPRIFVDLACPSRPLDVHRAKAVVDTCASRSLMAESLVRAMNLEVRPTSVSICDINNEPLKVLGMVKSCISRLDSECVYLPKCEADFLVVGDLSAVRADAVIGVDTIGAQGGVNVQFKDGELVEVVFGHRDRACPVVDNANPGSHQDAHPSRHVAVQSLDNGDVVLSSSDGSVRWKADAGYWELGWVWKEGSNPLSSFGSGIGEYKRSLTEEKEKLFASEVQGWIDKGWLVKHDEGRHGSPCTVLPLLAKVQDHKSSTPVRPCLDYRAVNSQILSHPGKEAPVCGDKLRSWRQVKSPENYQLLDISKAYLQVRVHPDLHRHQIVIWKNELYVMERMGFGLSIAPKYMDMIVSWVLRDFPGSDNYVDDIFTPRHDADRVKSALQAYGFPTKPAEDVPSSRILGLQLSRDNSGEVHWQRREGVDLNLPESPTKRDVFKWAGRVIGHYPVCGWLRPACSYAKRLTGSESPWDCPADPAAVSFCRKLEHRLTTDDPSRGVWKVDRDAENVAVWCDASDLALGVVLTCGDQVLEDQCWLRPVGDKKHINVAELTAVVEGISLAISYGMKKFTLFTDSRTVYGWLTSLLQNTKRVNVGGLYEVVVQRRLQVVEDLVVMSGLMIDVQWIATDKNKADRLTRVPSAWRQPNKSAEVVGATPTVKRPELTLPPPVSLDRVKAEQMADASICEVVEQITGGSEVKNARFKRVRQQLRVRDGMLYRTRQDPVDGVVEVPVLPRTLEDIVVCKSHEATGHGNWEIMWRSLANCCYFPGMAAACQEYVQKCPLCAAASPAGVPVLPTVRNDVPLCPWDIVQIDTLELGPSKSEAYHCVLVCLDMFSKWLKWCPCHSMMGQVLLTRF